VGFLSRRRPDGLDADRTAAEAVDDGEEHLAVDLVQSEFVDLEAAQRIGGHGLRNDAVGPHLREVANPLEEPIGYARRSPGASGGQEVVRMLTCISAAIMFASVVFPRPGGPYSRTWSICS